MLVSPTVAAAIGRELPEESGFIHGVRKALQLFLELSLQSILMDRFGMLLQSFQAG